MSETSTERGILDSIPDFAGGDDAGGADGGGDRGGSGSGDSSGAGGGRSSAAPSTSVTSAQPTDAQPVSPQQQQGAVQRRHDGLVEVPNAETPNVRDLVDPVTGRTVAAGGIERRVFEEGQRHQRENNQLRAQLQQLQQHVNSGNQLLQEAQRFNITPEQHQVAIRVMSDFMRDPVKTLEYLVEEVKSKGYQIPFLTQGVTQGMDMNAIARMLDAQMLPITEQHQRSQIHARAQAQANETLNELINTNPAAQQNLDVLAEMLQAQPSLTLDRAYTMMIQWAVGNGLDFTRNLKQQLTQQPAQQPTQQPSQQTRPLPGSRAFNSGAVPTADVNGQFSEHTGWGDIIRDAMRSSGYQIQ